MASARPSRVAALVATLDLFETGLELMRQNLGRQYPQATSEELARLLKAWLHDRPGAESGDCAGRRIDLHGRIA
jgi:Rv0078B-related antitoxin